MIAVLGCGNSNRCDDGVGPAVIRVLRTRLLDDRVLLIDAGTDGMATMFAARGRRSLIIVDACRSGSPPGAVFEVPGAEVAQSHVTAPNLHDFRWDDALYAGRQILRENFPTDVVVFLIEVESVAFGIGLSQTVSAAAAIVADRIIELVKASLPQGDAIA
jgi:hydrogenase maturation protease